MAFAVCLGAIAMMAGCSAGDGHITLIEPAGLETTLEQSGAIGAWTQVTTTHGDQIDVILTVRVPVEEQAADPGTFVALWAFRDEVTGMGTEEVQTERLHEAPQAEVIPAVCHSSRICTLQLHVVGSAAPAREAADLDWVDRVMLGLQVTIVRTFAGERHIQVLEPSFSDFGDGDGGTLAHPSKMTGRIAISPRILPGSARPIELPVGVFVRGPGANLLRFDWLAAVRQALAS